MTRQPVIRTWSDAIIADNFAGGGGASSGIETALGRSPDIAVNHDPEAIAIHRANHPDTKHFLENVWQVDPVKACGGRPVALAWFSPDCKHHSKAKGGKPREQKIRGLAWVAVRWAAAVKPRVIALENVEEFKDWGPLAKDGHPIAARKGQTFRAFVRKLERLGYDVEWRLLRACDYGAPTTRRRLFLVARCDGKRIVWPAPTHGPGRSAPYRTAAECIDWSLPCPSIFDRERPLADKTMTRIARGVRKFVIESARPFILPVNHGGDGRNDQRVHSVDEPLRTITSHGRGSHAIAVPYLVHRSNGERVGQAPRNRFGLVAAFLAKYYGQSDAQDLQLPLGTATTRDRFALVTVAIDGEEYVVVDIGMRMLTPRELFRAQGFGDEYQIDPVWNGKPLSKTAQIRMVGNSVSPPIAAAVVRAQMTEAA